MRSVMALLAVATAGSGWAAMLGQQTVPQLSPEDRVRVVAAESTAAGGFQVEVGCSETQLRTPVATVSWRPRPTREEAGGLRVDVAASKQGFAKGQFVKLFLGATPRLEPSVGLARESSSQGTLGRTLALEVEGGGRESAGDQSRVRVRNLEPGVIYFWRIAERPAQEWMGGRTVRVKAPACVADIVEEKQ